MQSLPSRERGLKWGVLAAINPPHLVAPLAGAWIEMRKPKGGIKTTGVAPLAGAWIEMTRRYGGLPDRDASLPSRERGLKSCVESAASISARVAPLAGAWIEISPFP